VQSSKISLYFPTNTRGELAQLTSETETSGDG